MPGINASPVTVTLMLRMLPMLTCAKVLGDVPLSPEYIVDKRLTIRFVAFSMVSPPTLTGPTLGMFICPSGEIVRFNWLCDAPHTSIISSSPAPSW